MIDSAAADAVEAERRGGMPDEASAEFRSDERARAAANFPVHVGVDCAKTFHKLVARGPDGRRRAAVRVEVSRAGFTEADRYLRSTFPRVARKRALVGMELAGNYGVTFAHYLLRRGYGVVMVLPVVTKRTREVEDLSPRKSDDKDAAQVCRLVGSGLYSPFAPLSARAATLRCLTLERRHLTREANRLRSRLRSILDVVWPEFETIFVKLEKRTPRAVLASFPLPADLGAVNVRTLRRMLRTISREQLNDARADALRQSALETIGIDTASDVRRAAIRRLLARWDLLDAQSARIDATLAELIERDPAFASLLTIPEISVVSAAAIAAEIGDIGRYQSPRQILKMAGLNLTRRQSGTSVLGPLRIAKRGRTALRQQLYLLAGRWCKRSGLFRPRYDAMLARNGGKRTKALVGLSRALVPLIWHVLKTGEPFDEAKWRLAH